MLIADEVAMLSPEEKRVLAASAIGRIFRMGARAAQTGDVEDYERCREIIMACGGEVDDYEVNWVRDRLKGAQGD